MIVFVQCVLHPHEGGGWLFSDVKHSPQDSEVERDGGRRVMPRSSVAIPENVSTIAPIRPDAMLPARIIWWGMTERFSTFIYTRLASVVTWKNLQCITNLYICQAGRNSDMGAWKV